MIVFFLFLKKKVPNSRVYHKDPRFLNDSQMGFLVFDSLEKSGELVNISNDYQGYNTLIHPIDSQGPQS